ncbi:MAG TPA: glycosyltransferase [bacterium]|nr:glycosyltransferase [bacterium]
MKIILASESFPPNVSGVAVATKNVAEQLSQRGHEVYVFTPGKVTSASIDRHYTDYTVFRLKSLKNPFRKNYRFTFIGKSILRRKLLEIKPDIIHLQDPAFIGTLLRDLGKEQHIPVVITNHFSLEYALSYIKFAQALTPLLKKQLCSYLSKFYNQCNTVITPTETFRRQVESWGCKVPTIAISNGLALERYQKHFSKEEIDKTKLVFHLPDNPLILYLGRIDKDKSIDVLIKSMPNVLSKTNAHLVVAGLGDELPAIKRLVSELKLDNSVTFLGFIDHDSEDFIKLYKAASVFAIPSTIETQSLVTLEALASGLPVVAANAGALPELVYHNKNGFLFKPGAYKELADNLITILMDDQKSKQFSKASFDIVKEHAISKSIDKLLDLYQSVISKK